MSFGLYQNDWATAQKITSAIASYTEQLGVSKEKSYALYKQHGTCLKGMLTEGIIDDGRVEDYLEKVHDIDYSDIQQDPAMRDMIRRCLTKDRRIVFTASTKEHASRCLAKVLAPSTVDDLFSVIVDKRTCKLDTKHSPASFAAAMDAVGVPPYVRASGPASCILIDDSVTNIKCAKQMRCTLFLFVPRWATRSGRGRIISSATCVIFSSATCGPPWNKKERGGREKRRINDALMS